MKPFGHHDAGQESADMLRHLYLQDVFTKQALSADVFVIIGRRGAGKTALATSMEFARVPNNPGERFFAPYISIGDLRAVWGLVEDLAKRFGDQPGSVEALARVWAFGFWHALMLGLIRHSEAARHSGTLAVRSYLGKTAYAKVDTQTPRDLLHASVRRFLEGIPDARKSPNTVIAELDALMGTGQFREAREALHAFARPEVPAALVIDSIETFEVRHHQVHLTFVALADSVRQVSAAWREFNAEVKCFLPAEILTSVLDGVWIDASGAVERRPTLPALGKLLGGALFLHWEAPDLLRMLCWRLAYYCDRTPDTPRLSVKPEWPAYRLRREVWDRFFPASDDIRGAGLDSWSAVSAHTQLRPRQMIMLCNHILGKVLGQGRRCAAWDDIEAGLRTGTKSLREDLFNTFSNVYPNAASAIGTLLVRREASRRDAVRPPYVLDESEVDRAAAMNRDMDNSIYWRMLLETGVLGTLEADELAAALDRSGGAARTEQPVCVRPRYEYAESDRLRPTKDQVLIVHPMFHGHLGIRTRPNDPVVSPLGPGE